MVGCQPFWRGFSPYFATRLLLHALTVQSWNETRTPHATEAGTPRRRRHKEATEPERKPGSGTGPNAKPAVAATKRRPSRKVSRQQEAEQNDKPRRRCHEEATEPERKPGSKKPSRTTSPAVAARKK
jgi:hypothetical protein